MGKGVEVDCVCPGCGGTRTVIKRYSYYTPATLCPECIKARKARAYESSVAQR